MLCGKVLNDYAEKKLNELESAVIRKGIKEALDAIRDDTPNSVLTMDVPILNDKGEQYGTQSVYSVISKVLTDRL